MKETTLRLTFTNSEKKKVSLVIAKPNTKLTKDEIHDGMTQIATANVFIDKEGADMYKMPYSAEFITREVTSVFNDSESVVAAGTK